MTDLTRTLAECELVIERGLATFVEVGQALMEILDSGLYAERYGTFEAYCIDRWGIRYERARQLMVAAEVAEQVQAATPTTVGVPNERTARELSPVPPADRPAVWREAVERAGGKPTAAAVRAVREERMPAARPVPVGDLLHETPRLGEVRPEVPPAPSMDAVMLKLAETDPTVTADLRASRVRTDVAKINHQFAVLGLHGGPEQVTAALGPERTELAAFAGECARWAEALHRLTAAGPRLVRGGER